MNYKVSESGGVATVFLDGALGFASNESFQALLKELSKSRPKKVAFNMSALSSIDSVGLGLLYIAKEDMDAISASFSLVSPRGAVARLLELTQAHETFEITP